MQRVSDQNPRRQNAKPEETSKIEAMMDPSVDEEDMRVDSGSGVVDGGAGGTGNPETMDQERRIRREIANSNERRRMQSINAGFQSLRTLLPHHEGEKLSKAAILQQTAEYIYTLEQEKTLLLSQNSQLKRLLSLNQQRLEGGDQDTSPQMKKKRISPPEEAAANIEEESFQTGTVTDINLQLMQEQRLRLRLEERVKSLERQLSMSSTPTTIALPSKPEPPAKNLLLTTAGGDNRAGQTAVTTPATRIAVAPSAPPTILLQPNQTPVNPLPAVTTLAPEKAVPTSVLQAAVAASKKEVEKPQPSGAVHAVEVERISNMPVLPSMPLPPNKIKAETSELVVSTESVGNEQRSYTVTAASNASRQNLDSIVEAIRHLEGDHLFSEDRRVVKEEVVDYSTAENIEVPNKKSAVTSIQLPQQPVSVSTATISRTSGVSNPSNASGGSGGIIIINP